MDWHLSITTWRGLDPSATHFYGTIESDDHEGPPKIRLTRPLTADEMESWERAGDETERFVDRDELITTAIEAWRNVTGGRGRLLLGIPVFEHRQVLA
jgi:hypothetical protein